MGLVFSISNFFIAKTSLANNWRSFSSSNLALVLDGFDCSFSMYIKENSFIKWYHNVRDCTESSYHLVYNIFHHYRTWQIEKTLPDILKRLSTTPLMQWCVISTPFLHSIFSNSYTFPNTSSPPLRHVVFWDFDEPL